MIDRDECPECGAEIVPGDERNEAVCVDCGVVVTKLDEKEGETSNKQPTPAVEWKLGSADSHINFSEEAFKNKSDLATSGRDLESINNDDSKESVETVAEWKMWYPCPICGSMKLTHIWESHQRAYATEDGGYGGPGKGVVEEYNYVECEDCGEVLLDEIGRSQ